MDDRFYVYCTGALIVGWVVVGISRKSFDPFAPIWLFLAGFFQVYVIQAFTSRDWAIRVRGEELVAMANARALWALVWFLIVYHCGIGKALAGIVPKPPDRWSTSLVTAISPFLFAWGLVCSGLIYAYRGQEISAEESLLFAFPFFMLIAGVLLIVTGRHADPPRPFLSWIGVGITMLYALIWMMNGKRSHPLFGILSAICAFYVSKGRRPSKLMLAATALACVLSVTVAINWRMTREYDRSYSGFLQFLVNFNPASILDNLNINRNEEEPQTRELASKETQEYGGFLLMMDTVPEKSEYNYGASYLRMVTTYIPRVVWPEKPIFGREEWVKAWIAGSEFKREADFTGPSIGILGATQLNGGAIATLIVLGVIALLLRTSYEFFRRYEALPWVQVWWSLSFYNSWLMTVNDDPFVWFYYIYGHGTLPPLVFLWVCHKFSGAPCKAAASGGVLSPAQV